MFCLVFLQCVAIFRKVDLSDLYFQKQFGEERILRKCNSVPWKLSVCMLFIFFLIFIIFRQYLKRPLAGTDDKADSISRYRLWVLISIRDFKGHVLRKDRWEMCDPVWRDLWMILKRTQNKVPLSFCKFL